MTLDRDWAEGWKFSYVVSRSRSEASRGRTTRTVAVTSSSWDVSAKGTVLVRWWMIFSVLFLQTPVCLGQTLLPGPIKVFQNKQTVRL